MLDTRTSDADVDETNTTLGLFEIEDENEETTVPAGDALTIQFIYPKYAKPIIDEIDRVLAQHYSFTDEELDFIINYDIKYRMGDDLGGDEDEGDE